MLLAPSYLVRRRRQCVMVAPSSTWHSLIFGELKSKLQHFLGKPSPKNVIILLFRQNKGSQSKKKSMCSIPLSCIGCRYGIRCCDRNGYGCVFVSGCYSSSGWFIYFIMELLNVYFFFIVYSMSQAASKKLCCLILVL